MHFPQGLSDTMFKSKEQIQIHSLSKYLWVLGHTATQHFPFQRYLGSISEGQSSPAPLERTELWAPAENHGSPPFCAGPSLSIGLLWLERPGNTPLGPGSPQPVLRLDQPSGSCYDCKKPSKITRWKLWKTTLITHRSWEVHSIAGATQRVHG